MRLLDTFIVSKDKARKILRGLRTDHASRVAANEVEKAEKIKRQINAVRSLYNI